jgi:hypothetical protein
VSSASNLITLHLLLWLKQYDDDDDDDDDDNTDETEAVSALASQL